MVSFPPGFDVTTMVTFYRDLAIPFISLVFLVTVFVILSKVLRKA